MPKPIKKPRVRHKKHTPVADVSLVNARNPGEAMNYIWIGFKYFLLKHTLKTVIVLMFIFGSALYIVYDHILPAKVRIEDAKPIGQTTEFSVIPYAYSQSRNGVPIIFNGQLYGYEDTTYIVKAVKDAPVLLVYDKLSKRVSKVEFYGTDRLRKEFSK